MLKKLLIGVLVLGLLIFLPNSALAVSVSKTSPNAGVSFCSENNGEILDSYMVFSTNKNSAKADGSDSIIVTYTNIMRSAGTTNEAPYCGNTNCRDSEWVTTSSNSDNQIYSTDEGVKISQGNLVFAAKCSRMTTSAKVTSTIPGEKTIKIGYPAGTIVLGKPDPNEYVILSLKVTFTSPTTSSTTSPTATTQKPSPPTITTINNEQLPENKVSTQTIRVGDPITFSGKTIPNATVRLYITSEPITAETKSDKDGNWSYTLTQALEPGDHKVEAEVRDEKGNTSDKVEIARFTIKSKTIPVQSKESEKIPRFIFTPLTYGLAGLAVILIGLLVYLVIKRRRAMG
jgi:hypothetical protein